MSWPQGSAHKSCGRKRQDQEVIIGQLRKVLEDYGCPQHWVDNQHADDEDDEEMRKQLFALGITAGVGWASDDVTGAVLDVEGVKNARSEELEFFKTTCVYKTVPRWMARGKKIIKTRWIDVNKGDEEKPDLRFRLVGREYADSVDWSVYAATQPLEAMRLILSVAATTIHDGHRIW